MELTLIETNAYLELKRRLRALSVQMADFQKILEEGLVKKRK